MSDLLRDDPGEIIELSGYYFNWREPKDFRPFNIVKE